MALNRRQFLEAETFGIAAAVLTSVSRPAIRPTPILRIALLHLAPLTGDLGYNRRLVETAVTTAAGRGAAWILTPDLCICGYSFADQIGTEWIMPQPDPWMRDFCQLVAQLHVTVFMSHPERDSQTATLHNSVFVIAANGAILGTHRKIDTLRVGAEPWSSLGDRVTDRTRLDARLYGGRKRDRQRRAAAPGVAFGTLGHVHGRVGSADTDLSNTGVSENRPRSVCTRDQR